EFSKSANIIFEPQISYGWGDNSSLQTQNTSNLYDNGTTKATNDGFSATNGDSKNMNASGMLMYRQRLGLPGRTLTSTVRFNYSNTNNDGFTQSLTNNTNALSGETSQSITNQRTEQLNKNASVNANVTYTEPMGNFFYIEANYQFQWNKQNSNKNAWNSGAVDVFDVNHLNYSTNGEVKDETYSNNIINDSKTHNVGANMLYQSDRLRAQVGATFRPQTTHNVTDRAAYKIDTTFTVYNWSPNAMVMWDANDYLNMRFFYRGNSSQPSISQLMPVPDNSNPMSISLGNPSLAPYFSHNVNSEFRYTNRQKFSSMNLRLNAGMTSNPIVNANWTSPTNVSYSMPFNGKNSTNASLNFTANFPVFVQNLTLSTTTSASTSSSYSYQGGTKINDEKYGGRDNFDYNLFLADYGDIQHAKDFITRKTQSMNASERLTLQFRTEDIELRVGGSTNVSKSWLTPTERETPYTWRNGVNGSFTWTWDITGMSLRTDASYNWYNNYESSVKPEVILNAEITKMVFKQRATIALRGADLLGQSQGFSYNVDSNGNIRESLSNVLGRYIIFSFTYRFGTFGGRGGRGGRGGGMPMGGGMPKGGGMPMGGGRF
ncbi:MAG: outer membrane beta-barrel protein, partial [Bacteroidia bacterium]|nr:outer membrane beta-barrel protein [Bacteroidia bacterium]